jgi:V-type H+-transporting ATPase subunit a
MFTFPFLFALMFGDFGHGILLTLIGAFFVIFEKKLAKGLNDIVEFLYYGLLLFFFFFFN